jgi:hypothetical protein
MLFEEMPQRHE